MDAGLSWPAQKVESTTLPFSMRHPTIRSACPTPHVTEHWRKASGHKRRWQLE
jgi:hypothetical protein